MSRFRKFRLILWKNWLFRKRQYILTFCEIILPTLFPAFFIYIRNDEKTKLKTEYHSEFTEFDAESIFHAPVADVLMYAPDSNLSRILIQDLINSSALFSYIGVPVASDEEMDNIALNSDIYSSMLGVSFVDLGNTLPRKLHYRIRHRLNNSNDWATDVLAGPISDPGPSAHVPYRRGFLWLQKVISMRFIELSVEEKNAQFEKQISLQRFPYPPYNKVDSRYSYLLRMYLPFFIVLGYIFVSPTLIKHIVQEKELGLKELMKLMGLPSWLQWCGWFVSAFTVMSVSAILIVELLCSDWFWLPVLSNASPWLFLFILLLYIASSICFCFFITTFFSKPSLATAVGMVVWLFSFYIPVTTMGGKFNKMSVIELMAFMLLPNMAITLSIQLILSFEAEGLSLRWNNIFNPSDPSRNLNMATIIFMLIFDILFYSFLTWYLDNILPSTFGIRKPWYFIFTKKYWHPRISENDPFSTKVTIKNFLDFEPDPVALVPVIKIENLTKKFGWRETGKSAVNNINLIIYEDQITALLGHNGAGKTTTISVLTGMFPPTSGTAYINNHNIRTETSFARRDIGMCPQQNILFNNLTVEEHFKFFGSLKISSSTVLEREVSMLIFKLQLLVVQHTLAKNLSEGIKRKVSLGIALIGDPKVVMLDEPALGLDPEARREIWDLLQEYKTGHCVILTTHSMEEADALADRIAIMVNGQIMCCGTPIFLKSRFGTGYLLNINKGEFCNVIRIIKILQDSIRGSRLSSNTVNNVSFILPMARKSSFPGAFKELEDNMKELGINNFGISVTTMEEVFLKVGENTETGENEPVTMSMRVTLPIIKNKGCSLWFQQFVGMILKRWYYTRRRWILFIVQVLLPVLMVLTVLELIATATNISLLEPPIVMDISQYKQSIALVTMPTHFIYWFTAAFPTNTKFINVSNIEEHIKNLPESYFPSYTQQYIVGAKIEIDEESNKLIATAWYNGQYYHAEPLSLNLLLNAILKYYARSTDYSITVENKPIPLSKEATKIEKFRHYAMWVMTSFVLISIGFSFLSSSFVVFPIHERTTKCKHLQLLTGISRIVFWGASFLWDFATHLLCCCFLLIVFFVLDTSHMLTGEGKTEILCLILFLYGWSAIPISYLASFLFTQSATGFTCLTILNLIAGFIFSWATSILFKLLPDSITVVIQWIFRFLPTYTVVNAFINMSNVSVMKITCDMQSCDWKLPDYLQWESPGIGQEIFMLVLTGCLYLMILILIEQDFMVSIWYEINKIDSLNAEVDIPRKLDSDVVIEKERVHKILRERKASRHAFVVNNLTKKFENYYAVNGLNFAMGNAECFGLLGINGAGKTTTIEMLTGNLVVTCGNAFAFGKSLIEHRHSYLSQIGYCPQFDGLIDYLTGEEMLIIFAHLRGIPGAYMREIINNFVVQFNLQDHAHKITSCYSVGSKRKLNAALAFIGDPLFVFLDEPTTGVDPITKRKIWDIIINAKSLGISVILTSHSFEECDILCSRVGIMVSGQFRCIGGTQYLKNRFSEGFIIVAKLKSVKDDQEMKKRQYRLQKYIQRQFPSAVLKDFHQGLVQYHIIDRKTKWTYLFEKMEKAKVRFTLEDYSIGQATLEQVFLSLAKQQ